jgi:glycerophosphodiester phosphodiesterase
MFITNAGKPPMMDLEVRASSLQVAVRFAKRWNLAGIVFASEVLVLCPRLVAYVKNYGLTCGSYGPQNNIPEYAKVSFEMDYPLKFIFASKKIGEKT